MLSRHKLMASLAVALFAVPVSAAPVVYVLNQVPSRWRASESWRLFWDGEEASIAGPFKDLERT